VVASLSHDIWLASTLALASIIGLLTVIVAVSRRVSDEQERS